MFKALIPAAALAAIIAGGAQAQDNLAFEGFYGGVQLGFYAPETGTGIGFDGGENVALFGGYNHAIGQDWIVGGEVSFGTELGFSLAMPAVDYTLEDMISLRGRVGYVMGDFMVYGSVGYLDSTISANIAPGLSLNADGYTYGLGLEMMLNENMSARIEYLGSDLQIESGATLNTNGVGLGLVFHF